MINSAALLRLADHVRNDGLADADTDDERHLRVLSVPAFRPSAWSR